jgi:alanine racemase
MYGCYPSDEVNKSEMELKPAMSVKASIMHLKEVPEGSTVSYGQRFTASRKSKIATLALGYADGFPRPYSMKGKVIVGGQFAPIAGNICMDQFMIDVTDIPDVKVGDEVIVMGSDGIWDVMNSVEIVGYVFERTTGNNRVERDRIAEEIVEECRSAYLRKD